MEKYLQQFNQLPPVQRFGIFGGIAVVVVVLWYVLLYQDVISQQDALKAKIVKANQELTEKKMMVSELNNFQREVERVQQQFQAALKELPDRQEIPALLQKLSRLARKAGLDIVSFEPKQEMIQEFYAEVPVKLALRGSYHDVANFYDEISKLPRIVSIKNIEFKAFVAKDASAAAAGSQRRQLLDVSCQAVTFRYLKEGEGKPVEAADGKDKGKGKPKVIKKK